MSSEQNAGQEPRKPGRPPGASRAANRPKRTPLGQRSRLSLNGVEIPKGMVGRVINDKPGRIQEALEAGYRFIMSDGQLGDERCSDPTKMGSYVTKHVGSVMTAYLMAIPKEFYDEDQAAKQQRVTESEKAMKAPPKKLQFEGKPGDGTVYGPGLTDE